MEPKQMQKQLAEVLKTMKKVGHRDDLVRRGDVLESVRTACIRKHVPFKSKSPEGKMAMDAVWSIHTAPAAVPAAELGAENVYDRLRELLKADREGRCIVLMVVPGNTPAADVVVIKNKEAYLVRPWAVSVRPFGGKSGGLVCSYKTDGTLDFTDISIGKTVFLPHETEKIEAALEKMREEDHG